MFYMLAEGKTDGPEDYVYVNMGMVRTIRTADKIVTLEFVDGSTRAYRMPTNVDWVHDDLRVMSSIVPANGWKRATVEGSHIFYDTIIAFGIGEGVTAYTLEGALGTWDAAVDPESGLFVMSGGGEQYTEENYLKMMKGHQERWDKEDKEVGDDVCGTG